MREMREMMKMREMREMMNIEVSRSQSEVIGMIF